MRSTGCASSYESRWSAVIGAFRSSLFRCEVVSQEVRFEVVPSVVRWCTGLLLCFLIVGIHASGISIPLSLLMLSGWSLMWIASLTLRVYQCESRSINFTLFQSGWWPVLLACSETAEFSAKISAERSLQQSCRDRRNALYARLQNHGHHEVTKNSPGAYYTRPLSCAGNTPW